MPSSPVLRFLVCGALAWPGALAGQQVSAPAADTFHDDGARALILHALALRDSAAAGLQSYEATATERTHIGMAVTRRLPLRSRTLYHREQAARVYWQRGGRHTVRWIGRREGTPMTGDDWGDKAPFGIGFDLVEELDLDDVGIELLFDPLGDRVDFFDAGFIQPISSAGLRLYHFASGDTMQIRLPSRTITLVEVVVRPRETAWEALEGSLWFDRETGVLVRAAYRPSGVWDMDVREPGDLDDVPGFLKPAVGTVHSVVIEYGLFEQRWWLPRRVVGEGTFDWGHGLVRMPLTLEWTLSGHVINNAPGPDVTPGPDLVSAGRSTFGDNGRRQRVEYLAPAGVDLSRASELPPPLGAGATLAFSRAELEPLLARLEQIAGPEPASRAPTLQRVLLTSLRYDRVRGLSSGYSVDIDAGRFRLTPELSVATAVPDVYGGVRIARGGIALAGYRDLADASDWNFGGLGNSVATMLFGHDGGDYYRVTGGSLALSSGGESSRIRVEAFGEQQRPIDRQTSISVATIGGGSLRPNLQAERLDLAGVRGEVAGQWGADVQSAVLNWRLRAEAATGDADYARGLATLRLTGPLGDAAAGALEVAAGMAGSGAPPQREFLLGGVGTLRGVGENAVGGPAFWLVRAEGGAGMPGLRGLLFLDAGWAGPRDAWTRSRPTAGAGVGVSIMDGLLRMDLARGVLRSHAWRAYFYIDALL